MRTRSTGGDLVDTTGDGCGGSLAPSPTDSRSGVTSAGKPRVTVSSESVHLHDLACFDPDVVSAAQLSPEPERTILEMLSTGARVLRFASASLDASMLERTVADLEEGFQSRLDSTVTVLDDKTQGLLDPDSGSIPRTLKQVREEIAKQLNDTFNPELTTSALSIIDSTLGKHKGDINRDVRRLLDPASPDSPLNGLEARLREHSREQAKDLHEVVEKIARAVAVQQAQAEMLDKTTAKGFDYEDLVEAAVDRVASVYGDHCANVGREAGVGGTDKGDLLVTLSPDDSAGQDLRFVLECKDRRLSKPGVKSELEACMQNRGAAAGVLVFAHDDANPYHVPFTYSGNRAVVVYDREHPDDQVLQVAYAWARWMTRRAQSADETLDAETILAALRDAEAGLAKKTQVLTGLTQASNGIESARKAVEALADQVAEALGQMRAALDP